LQEKNRIILVFFDEREAPFWYHCLRKRQEWRETGGAMTIGERLKRLRELAGLSQGELARRAGVNRPIISDLESNKRQNITVDTAKRLARTLGVSLDLLVGMDEDELCPAATQLVGA
jgi:plasmid maintenance system antidote protein VapI